MQIKLNLFKYVDTILVNEMYGFDLQRRLYLHYNAIPCNVAIVLLVNFMQPNPSDFSPREFCKIFFQQCIDGSVAGGHGDPSVPRLPPLVAPSATRHITSVLELESHSILQRQPLPHTQAPGPPCEQRECET